MEKTRLRAALFSALFSVFFFISCVRRQTGGFTERSFAAPAGGFGFSYVDAPRATLLPAAWTLENWTRDVNGKPDAQKEKGIYLSEVEWPMEDGKLKWMKFVTHELRYDHPSGATIWVRLLPVPPRQASRNLNVIAENWVNSISGTVFDYTFYEVEGAKRIGSKILESKSATVAGQPAHRIVFEVVNLDQLRLDANAPRSRAAAYFIQAPVTKELQKTGPSNLKIWAPACIFLGLVAPADQYDAVVADFDSLVSRMWVEPSKAASGAAKPGG